MKTNYASELLSKLAFKMKENKKLSLAVYGVLIGLGVLLYAFAAADGSAPVKNAETEAVPITSVSENEREIERRLEETLMSIRGAGEVRVMITFDSTTEIVPAMSVDTQSTASGTAESRTESKQVETVSKGGEYEPIVLYEKQPAVRGVIVVAEGAADISVRMNLENAVKTALGVDIACVEVFEMKAIDKE